MQSKALANRSAFVLCRAFCSEFVEAMSTFHKGTTEEKLKFIFRVYDINNDGKISNGELFTVLKGKKNSLKIKAIFLFLRLL